jgi:PadR family transcriptional regulator
VAKSAGGATRPGNKVIRDLFLGFVKVHILHYADRCPVYGASVIDELKRLDYHAWPGMLYPVLALMEADGYLEREERVVNGTRRKYYSITPFGKQALGDVRTKARELVEEIADPSMGGLLASERPQGARRRRRDRNGSGSARRR